MFNKIIIVGNLKQEMETKVKILCLWIFHFLEEQQR